MIDTSQIREHMEIVDSSGEHVGTVDHMSGENEIKLTRKDPAAHGKHHYLPIDSIGSIDEKVHLRCSAEEAHRMSREE